jgi:carboxyl-terminal processing protease
MRKLLFVLAFTLAACGQTGGQGNDTTIATQPTESAPSPTTTMPAGLPLEIQTCATPPVTFSGLCQVHELLAGWHVDRPLSDSDLAGVATRALSDFITTETEEPPRTFICAVPNEAFVDFCHELSEMITRSQVPIGPAVDHAVTAMVDRMLGPFTYYVPPDQAGTFRSNGVVSGVGVLLDATDAAGSKCAVLGGACSLEVVFVLEDNPGADAGLAPGDTITAVDGQSVDGKGFSATAGLIAGDETGTVDLAILREGESFTLTIERAELTIPTVVVRLPQPGVGYIRIPDFEDDIPALVDEGLRSLAETLPTSIVLDLRDNPGGYVDSAVDVASQFIDGGPVLGTFGPDEEIEYTATTGGLVTDQQLIVLVNQGSASAAEVLAGALRDRRSATIVGTNTFGKDAVQIRFDLRNGGELYIAVARWATPNGTTVGNGGLVPDRELEFSADMTIEEAVEAALEASS